MFATGDGALTTNLKKQNFGDGNTEGDASRSRLDLAPSSGVEGHRSQSKVRFQILKDF